jgi:hypothetical protein
LIFKKDFIRNHLLFGIKKKEKKGMLADVDKWIDIARECKYLPENDMKVRRS